MFNEPAVVIVLPPGVKSDGISGHWSDAEGPNNFRLRYEKMCQSHGLKATITASVERDILVVETEKESEALKPDYPHQMPGPYDPPWLGTRMYSISGWFAQEMRGERCSFGFGGFFRRITEDAHPDCQCFDGLLVDTYGCSEISGTMTEHALVFDKQYFSSENFGPVRHRVKYRMEKEGQIWKGKYELVGSSLSDEAACTITPSFDDVFGMVIGKPR